MLPKFMYNTRRVLYTNSEAEHLKDKKYNVGSFPYQIRT